MVTLTRVTDRKEFKWPILIKFGLIRPIPTHSDPVRGGGYGGNLGSPNLGSPSFEKMIDQIGGGGQGEPRFPLRMLSLICYCCLVYCGYKLGKFLMKYVYDTFIVNDYDFPSGMTQYTLLFDGLVHYACQITARSLFFILTGVNIDGFSILGSTPATGVFDDTSGSTGYSNMVTYKSFVWCDERKVGYTTSYFHALIYYNGYIYQSYRTHRHRWFSWCD